MLLSRFTTLLSLALLPLPALPQLPSQPESATTDCADTLQFGTDQNANAIVMQALDSGDYSALAGLQQQHPVDYCRELVIVAPDLLLALPDLQFPELLGRLANSSSPEQRNTLFATFASLWLAPQTAGNGEITQPRATTRDFLNEYWRGDPADLRSNRISLIAIVARLDLTQGGSTIGEGRLVYQLENGNDYLNPDMTMIAEFELPALIPDTSVLLNQIYWAKLWHSLGNPRLNRQDYLGQLQRMVGLYATKAAFRRLRTNEQIAHSGWELREIHLDASGPRFIQASILPETPGEERRKGNLKPELENYLNRTEVIASILSGQPHFATYEPSLVGNSASFEIITPKVWNLANTRADIAYLMAFNTCNGCHFQLDQSVQHITRTWPGESATLSKFLLTEITLEHALADCLQTPPAPGCGINVDGQPTWNERKNRSMTLFEDATINLNQESIFNHQHYQPLPYRHH